MADVDMHVHTIYSRADGLATPVDIVRMAERKGLCAVAFTDHDTMDAIPVALSIDTPVKVIPGCEVSSAEGHILSYFVTSPVEPGLSAAETIERIHAQGGLAVASHPLDVRRHGVGDLAFTLPFDAIEARNGHNISTNKETESRAVKAGIPVIAGTDAHMAKEVGTCITRFPYCDDFADHIKGGRTELLGSHVSFLVLFEHAVRTHVLHQAGR